MKKKIMIITGAIAFAASWGIIKYYSPTKALPTDAIWVQTTTVKTSTLPLTVTAIGTLVARSVEITPEAAGHVAKILFQDGTFVKAGAPLIQLDDAVYQAKITSAKAQLAYSENNYHRMVLLGKQGAIAQQAIDQAEAELKERRATADEAQVLLNDMRLMAPFDGVVGKSKVNLGDYVTIGQSVVTLTDTKHLHIEYNLPEKYLPLIKLGQQVSITNSAYPNKLFTGTVAYISPTINTDNRSISLYAEIPNDANQLAAGMFVTVSQSLGNVDQVLMIPSRSLIPILEGEQVYKIVDGKAQAITVSIGQRTEKEVQILSGLVSGDIIITDGQLKVKNGALVNVVKNKEM